MNALKELMRDSLAFWDRFFFGRISLLPLGVFRFVFGLNLLVMYTIRLFDWRFYFTDEGFVAGREALEILPEFYRPFFSWYPMTESMTWGLHVVFVLAIFLLMIGLWGRWMALVAYVLHLAFAQRNFSIVYGADIVTTFFLFALVFTDNSRRFSLDAWLRNGRARIMGPLNSMFSTIGVRFIQIQLCIIYGYTGLEKLKGPTWWDGSAVWAVIGNQQLMMFDASWLQDFPVVIAIMTHTALLFEVYFPVLIWLSAIRRWTIAFGWMLHSMIALTVGLVFFSGAMMSAYFVFIDTDWLRARVAPLVPSRWIGVDEA